MAYEKNVKVHIVTDIKVNQKSLIYRPQREVQTGNMTPLERRMLAAIKANITPL